MATFNLIRKGVISSLATIFDPHLLRITLHTPIASTLGTVHHKSSDVDILDIFTANILSAERTSKTTNHERSKMLMKGSEKKHIACKKYATPNVKSWTQKEIDNYLLIIIDCGDRKTLIDIVRQILVLKRLPSDTVILRVLSYLCDDSDDSMATISKLIDLCEQMNIAFYAKNMEFAPFLSQYLWKLKRFDDAVHILNTIYATTNKEAKVIVLRNYRQIIFDAIKNQDEIVVDKMVMNAESIKTKHKDPILISYVWSDCFFSELFRNQRKADELFQAHTEIREIVAKNISWIALKLLQLHNIDGIHRLIEICLEFKMKHEVGICSTVLFDYHCK